MKARVRVSMEVVVDVDEPPVEARAVEYVSGLLAPARTAPIEQSIALTVALPGGMTEEMRKAALEAYKVDQTQVMALLDSAKWDVNVVQ